MSLREQIIEKAKTVREIYDYVWNNVHSPSYGEDEEMKERWVPENFVLGLLDKAVAEKAKTLCEVAFDCSICIEKDSVKKCGIMQTKWVSVAELVELEEAKQP